MRTFQVLGTLFSCKVTPWLPNKKLYFCVRNDNLGHQETPTFQTDADLESFVFFYLTLICVFSYFIIIKIVFLNEKNGRRNFP